jgi:hypothetical protein
LSILVVAAARTKSSEEAFVRDATKQKLYIGGGIALGAVALIGLTAWATSGSNVDKKPATVTSEQDAEIRQTTAELLKYEGSPGVLRDIALKLKAVGYPNLAAMLQDRANELGA